MVTLVLLPGMDGTGELFAPFVEAFAGATKVVGYPTTSLLGYAELEAVARAELPSHEPYVLLGESFSGPIAISISATRPVNLLGVVLCASFARSPHPVLGNMAPLSRFVPMKPPLKLLEFFLCGEHATPSLRKALRSALSKVPARVLANRLEAVAKVDVTSKLGLVQVPLLYLRALHDRIVPETASKTVSAYARNTQVVDVDAPHFLLQSAPAQASHAIRDFLATVRNAL